MDDMVEVEQSDRDSAADMWNEIQRWSWADWQDGWIRDGTSDHGPLVQAFARVRAAEREVCAKVADAIADAHDKCGGVEWAAGAEYVATAIRNRGRIE